MDPHRWRVLALTIQHERRSDARSVFQPLQTMNSSITPGLLIVSILLTALGVVGMEDAFSAAQRHQCKRLEATHQVLALRGFTGTNHFCVDNRDI